MPAQRKITESFARRAARWIAAAGGKPVRTPAPAAPRRALAGVVAALLLRPR